MSFYDLIANFYSKASIGRADLLALKKFAPPDPEQIDAVAKLAATSGYDKLAKLLLKASAIDDVFLHRAILAGFVNIFIRIFPLANPDSQFLDGDNIALLIRGILAGRLPAGAVLSVAARQQLSAALLTLYWLANGSDKNWSLHERAILPQLKATPAAFLAGLFHPGLKFQHEQMQERFEKAICQRDEYREKAAIAAGRLARCEAGQADLEKALAEKEAELELLRQETARLAKELAAQAVMSASRLAAQKGEIAARAALCQDLLTSGLAGLSAGRLDAGIDHIERGLDNLSSLLASLAASPE